jgi:hypothetical protein
MKDKNDKEWNDTIITIIEGLAPFIVIALYFLVFYLGAKYGNK